MTHAPRILQVLRPPLEHYPPSINQSNILVEHGFRVSAVQEFKIPGNAIDVGLDPQVERYYINAGTPPVSLLGRIVRVMKYRRGVRQLVERLHPDLVIAYDAEAAWAVGDGALRCKAKLVWHFHEVPEDQKSAWTTNFTNRYVWKNAKRPDLIVFPDPGRAGVYAREAGIDLSAIQIVANCPRSVVTPPKPALHTILGDRIPPQARVVLYHGAIGSDHGLEVAIRSMVQWPSDAYLVAKGRVRSVYAEHLTALARSLDMAHRFILIDPGFQSTEEHYAFVAGADVGWTVLEPISNAWTYSALASNKRFECMALGVPQISNSGPLLRELVEDNGCGLCIPHDSVDSAAAAVNRILTNEALRKQMVEHSRQLHLQQYNYDAQFTPVLSRLQQMVRDNSPCTNGNNP